MSFAGSIDLRRGGAALRALPKPSFAALRRFRPSRKGLAIAVVTALILSVAGWFLLRNSSLVAVQQVRVVGLGGYYDRQARKAVETEAMQMTTMNVDKQALADAAAAYVSVSGVKIETDFPHGLTVYVDVRRPVAAARVGNEMVGLTGKGLILSSSTSLTGLPVLEVAGPLKNSHITDQKALEAVAVLGAAPDVLLRHVKTVRWGRNGLMIVLDRGVELYFGDATRAGAKWRAVAAVLADPATRGASYLDLRAPERPAIGGLGAAPITVKPSTLSAGSTAATAAAEDTAADPVGTPEATQNQAQGQGTAQTQTQTQQQQQPATEQQTAPAAGGAAGPAGGQ